MWKMFIPILTVFSLSLMIVNCNSKKSSENDPVVSVLDDDQEMNAAMQRASNTLNEFIERFTHPRTSDKWFLVKGRFTYEGRVEHIWVADLVFDGKVFLGVLANEPKLPGFDFPIGVDRFGITHRVFAFRLL